MGQVHLSCDIIWLWCMFYPALPNNVRQDEDQLILIQMDAHCIWLALAPRAIAVKHGTARVAPAIIGGASIQAANYRVAREETIDHRTAAIGTAKHRAVKMAAANHGAVAEAAANHVAVELDDPAEWEPIAQPTLDADGMLIEAPGHPNIEHCM